MNDRIIIKIFRDFSEDSIKIVAFKMMGHDKQLYNFYSGETRIIQSFNQIPQEFIMKIPGYLGGEFLVAFAQALSNEGIKTDNDHKIAGILEATKKHLEDMRALVFKKAVE